MVLPIVSLKSVAIRLEHGVILFLLVVLTVSFSRKSLYHFLPNLLYFPIHVSGLNIIVLIRFILKKQLRAIIFAILLRFYSVCICVRLI